MKKQFYVLHRWFGIAACLVVISWSLSGFLHPIMSWTQPRSIKMSLETAALEPQNLKISLPDALAKNNLAEIGGLSIVSFGGATYYQIAPPDSDDFVYLNVGNGGVLENGDRLYAIFLARYYLNDDESNVKSVERVTEFETDYLAVNRLLPAWRVSFERADGMRAFVDTASGRLGTLSDNRKTWLSWAFVNFHSFEISFLPAPLKQFVIGILMATVFLASLSGILVYIFFWRSFARKNSLPTTRKSRLQKYHRAIGIGVAWVSLMASFSGGYHTLHKAFVGENASVKSKAQFSISELDFPLSELLKRESNALSINNISLVGMARATYYRILFADKSVEYFDAKTGARALGGDRRYAQFLAAEFTNRHSSEIVQIEPVVNFSPEYGFINKRLPVVKIQYADGERCFVETSSGQLALRASRADVLEGYSFSFLHKWEFASGLGRVPRDLLLMTFTLANAVVAALGLWLFIVWRGGNRSQSGLPAPIILADTSVESPSRRKRESLSIWRKYILAIIFAAVILTSVNSCSDVPETPTRGNQQRRFEFRGQVLQISKKARRVTFKHDEIKGYMEPMEAMEFALASEADYDALAVGDEITATLVVTADNRSLVENIDVVSRHPANRSSGDSPKSVQSSPDSHQH